MARIACFVIAVTALGLSACTNPYDPVQRGLGGGYWAPLLVRRLEQRRVAGREPPSEQRSEGRPALLEELRVHLHRHQAPTTATRPTELLLTDILLIVTQPMDTQATHSRAMDIQAIRGLPATPVPRPMDIRAALDNRLTRLHRAMGFQATWEPPPIQVMGRRASRASRHTRIPRAINCRTTRDALVTQVHPAMDYQARKDALLTPVHRVMSCKATRDSPYTPVRRAMDTKAARYTLRPRFRLWTPRLWIFQQSRFRGLVSWAEYGIEPAS
jgi:hypothetical protein